MHLDNLLPRQIGALAAPASLLRRLLHPRLVSFGLLANLAVMQRRGIFDGIDAIVDVGANIGQFAYMISRVCPGVPVYSLEPDAGCQAELQQTFRRHQIPGRIFPLAAAEREGEATLHVEGESTGNSLLPGIQRGAGSAPVQTVRTATLDGLLAGFGTSGRILLKLDVQGFELQALAGATRLLERCRALIVEVSFESAYRGGAAAHEVMEHLARQGFRLQGILDTLRHGRERACALREADLLYVKDAPPAA
jgi:FkbM family methyltransferase